MGVCVNRIGTLVVPRVRETWPQYATFIIRAHNQTRSSVFLLAICFFGSRDPISSFFRLRTDGSIERFDLSVDSRLLRASIKRLTPSLDNKMELLAKFIERGNMSIFHMLTRAATGATIQQLASAACIGGDYNEVDTAFFRFAASLHQFGFGSGSIALSLALCALPGPTPNRG